ncbi:alpha/beta hydrolase [Kribbella sandramycini]|uniref:Alpha/beta hydrolase n=1 Tax=Kribbella sandramycini TaxID=60450 RepID=A0A7Y4L0D4_9ACTN|nr:pimeloyl-ACP methyl ester carboxylesterase [Kribbella sandramycini]NOL41985.1 alpha/beta hydrolase [Kribbella sandramycini]
MTAPVVLVPGLGLGPESYAPTVEHLPMRHNVVTLPGYGEPAGEREDLHPEALAALLEQKVRERSVLVGHSAGAQIVVELAVAHPELAHALVLIAPTGDVGSAGWLDLGMRWLESAAPESPRLIPVLAPQYVRTTFPTIARAAAACRRHDLAKVITRVKAPIVIVRSRHDKLSSDDWARRLAELSHGESRTLNTGAHMPVLTNGPELAALIQRAATARPTD